MFDMTSYYRNNLDSICLKM